MQHITSALPFCTFATYLELPLVASCTTATEPPLVIFNTHCCTNEVKVSDLVKFLLSITHLQEPTIRVDGGPPLITPESLQDLKTNISGQAGNTTSNYANKQAALIVSLSLPSPLKPTVHLCSEDVVLHFFQARDL